MMVEECLNALTFVCIHRDIFLDYDKIIGIYESKCPSRMLLINIINPDIKVLVYFEKLIRFYQ